MDWTGFARLLPELFLTMTLAFTIFAEITHFGEDVRLVTATAWVGLAAAFVQVLISYTQGRAVLFSGAISVDGFSLFFKGLFILLAGSSLISLRWSTEIQGRRVTEFVALILGTTLAFVVAASAVDLFLLALALQLGFLQLSVLAAFDKSSRKSSEAGTKLFLVSGVSGILFVVAAALVLKQTGNFQMKDVHDVFTSASDTSGALSAVFVLFFMAVLAFAGSFPAHLWVPDVLEGSPTPAAGFVSQISRATAFAVLTRLLIAMISVPGGQAGEWQSIAGIQWSTLLGVVSAACMLLGPLYALRQKQIRRIISGLLLGETGFLLMGVLVLDQAGISAMLFVLAVSSFAAMAAFAVLTHWLRRERLDESGRSRGETRDSLVALRGKINEETASSLVFVLALLTLAGAPPFGGFLGRFALMTAALKHSQVALVCVSILSIALSCIAAGRVTYSLFWGVLNKKSGSESKAGGPDARSDAKSEAKGEGRNLGIAASDKANEMSPTIGGGHQAALRWNEWVWVGWAGPMVVVAIFAQWLFDLTSRSLGFIFW